MADPLDVGSKKPSDYTSFTAPVTQGAPVKEAGKAPPSQLIKDVVTSSGAQATATKAKADSPTLAPPTAYPPEVITAAIAVIQANPWLSQSSHLASLAKVMYEIIALQSEIRLDEGQLDAQIRDMIFDMAIDNAEVAKTLKNKEAQEQFIQAATSFTSAGVSVAQGLKLTQNRGQAINKVDGEINAVKTDQTNKVAAITDRINRQGLVAAHDPASFIPKTPAEVTAMLKDPAQDPGKLITKQERADYNQLSSQLESMTRERQTNIYRTQSSLDQGTQSSADVVKQTSSGIGSIMSALIKQEQGKLEQEKQTREGLIQSFNKYNDGVSKAKEDAKSTIKEVLDSLVRSIADVVRAHQMKG